MTDRYFPMHEGATNKIMDERDEAIAAAYKVPPAIAGFVFIHHEDCYLRYDYDPNPNCKCFDWTSPNVSDNVITLTDEELAKIKRQMADVDKRRLNVKDTHQQLLIDPDPGYTYAEWTAYLDGLLQGLKAAERHDDGEA